MLRPPPLSYRPLILGLLVAVAALLFFAWLSEEMLAGDTVHFDEQVRAWVHQYASPAMTRVMRGISFVGSPGVLLGLGVLVVAGYSRGGKPRMALLFVITVLGAEVLDQILKLVFRRTRPVAFFGLPEPLGYSFPSGHSLVSCAFFGVLAAFAAARTKTPALAWLYRIAAALLIALIGLSRIYLGVHYPSDVIAGYAAALVWVFSVASARRWMRRTRGGQGSS